MQRIEPRQAHDMLQRGNAYFLDVRSEAAFSQATEHIPGDHRYSPGQLEQWWSEVPPGRHLVAYCT